MNKIIFLAVVFLAGTIGAECALPCRVSKEHMKVICKDAGKLHKKGSRRFKKSVKFRKAMYCQMSPHRKVPLYILMAIVDKWEKLHPKSYNHYAGAVHQDVINYVYKKKQENIALIGF